MGTLDAGGVGVTALSIFRARRVTLEVRQRIPAMLRFGIIAASIIFGLTVSLALLVSAGVNIHSVYEEFLVFTFFNAEGLSTVVVESTPLVLVGLSAAAAFRVNFWNIGIEGQFLMGVVGVTLIAIFDIGPESLRLPLMFFFGVVFGGLWALPPAYLKIHLKINEVITTLLFNYVAFYFVLNQVYGSWKDPVDKFPHSEQYETFERLPRIGWEEVNWGVLIAGIAIVLIWLLVERSRFGIKSRFCGINPGMAVAIGIPVSLITAISAMVSGGLAGSAGFVIASAHEFRLTPGIAAGYGFSGIVIAFLAGNRPLGVLVVAFLMGGLYVSGESLKIFYKLPAAMVGLIQAIVVLSVAASEFFVRYRIRLARYEEEG
ncbi:MAG: ABC transporter permease [Arenicellales bacterium]|nr:ABC transporter permease [Arenicellales bacterium]